jgi:tetratricopeptide (TPR) repeat protein
MSISDSKWWLDDLTEVCVQFQMDLSCLADKELEDDAARRAIAHLESCSTCKEFFDDTRTQARALRDLSNPEALAGQFRMLVGFQDDDDFETIDMVSKLSTIFYQLGKAYVLSAIDPGYRMRPFEEPINIVGYQAKGRGFVDGVLSKGEGLRGGLNWEEKRHMLNGQLEKIVDPLEKGRRLLKEAMAVDASNEEARFYLSFADMHDGKIIRAARDFRKLFQEAIDPANRAHSAMTLGLLHIKQGDRRSAIACFRWVTMSGLAEEDDRFYVARFNLGINYAWLGDQRRSLAAFRKLIDLHPDRLGDILQAFANSESTREVIIQQPGFLEALFETCPELFQESASISVSEGDVQ